MVSAPDVPRSVRLTDPRALRAYAHPTRMALVALLRRDGPQTATQAARAIGQSVASCSFHLRQMAKYGLVEEAGGRGREKPWRATAMFTELDPSTAAGPVGATDLGGGGSDPGGGAADPGGVQAVRLAAQAVQLAVVGQYFELVARWIRAQPREPAEWREAAEFGDTMLHLTAAELGELGAGMRRLVEPYLSRLGQPPPPGTRPVTVLAMAFPTPPAGHDAPAG